MIRGLGRTGAALQLIVFFCTLFQLDSIAGMTDTRLGSFATIKQRISSGIECRLFDIKSQGAVVGIHQLSPVMAIRDRAKRMYLLEQKIAISLLTHARERITAEKNFWGDRRTALYDTVQKLEKHFDQNKERHNLEYTLAVLRCKEYQQFNTDYGNCACPPKDQEIVLKELQNDACLARQTITQLLLDQSLRSDEYIQEHTVLNEKIGYTGSKYLEQYQEELEVRYLLLSKRLQYNNCFNDLACCLQSRRLS